MTDKKKTSKLTNIQQQNPGLLAGIGRTVRLVLRLIGDKRVNFFLKLLPISTLVYLISPFDTFPVLDDALVIGLGTYAFIELCPPDVVKEHQERLAGITRPEADVEITEPPVLEASFTEEQDELDNHEDTLE